jgi:hypothetical protein
MKVTQYTENGRTYEQKVYDSGKIIIKDVTPAITGPIRVSHRELLIRIAEKLGVSTE